MKFKIRTSCAAFMAAAFTLTAVNATPTIRISDGLGNSVTIADGGAAVIVGAGSATGGGDSAATAGIVLFNGTVGAWSLNVDTGVAKPFLGSPTQPYLDLSFNASGGVGTLTISFSENGFGPYTGGMLASIGGTTTGTVSFQTFKDASNAIFGSATLMTNSGVLVGPAFSTSAGGNGTGANPYSMTEVVAITHTSSTQHTTGDASLNIPEGGFTLSLLGGAMLGLGLLRRKLTKA